MQHGLGQVILIVIMLFFHSFACSQASLTESRSILPGELIETNGEEKAPENLSAPVPLDREPAEDSDESISPPQNISGSYLICAEAKAATAENPETIINCGLRDQVSSNKVDISSFAYRQWSYQVVDVTSPVTAFIAELSTSLEWHVEITLKGSSLDEIQTAQNDIRFFLTVEDDTGTKFREIGGLSLSCTRLAGGTWVPVPGDSIYGTNAFCVQKYAASNLSNVPTSQAGTAPWANITQSSALSACASLGIGYHLLTNAEWMTIAANLANVGSNWSGGTVGTGILRRGHSDNNPDRACAANANDDDAFVESDCIGSSTGNFVERRTSMLSNAAVVWDIGGNLWNWVDYFNASDKPTPAQALYYEFASITGSATTPKAHLVPVNSAQPWWNNSWNSQQGIGRMHPGANASGGAMLRGLFWNGGVNAGSFSAGMFDDQFTANLAFGFRCAWQP
ncbi:MAG: hypothetical protein ACOH5I_22025 [Oligoflexus sp.]